MVTRTTPTYTQTVDRNSAVGDLSIGAYMYSKLEALARHAAFESLMLAHCYHRSFISLGIWNLRQDCAHTLTYYYINVRYQLYYRIFNLMMLLYSQVILDKFINLWLCCELKRLYYVMKFIDNVWDKKEVNSMYFLPTECVKLYNL